MSPRTASLLETNACSLSCHFTVLLLRVAIAARAPFEDVTTFDSLPSMRVASEIQSWGEGPMSRERNARKTRKNASAQGSLKFREVSNGFREGTRREKARLKKVSYLLTYLLSQLVSQTKICTLHVVVLCFLQVLRRHI